jgi:drug/metabolite transporter (DMT)-like permease
MLVALSAVWGASFMFIKIGVRELTPATLIWGRVGIAALTLAPLGLRAANRASLRRSWRPQIVVGLLNTAVPFWLLSWSETRIDSGLAAIIQASAPLFAALFALVYFREERSTGLRLVGVVVGFVGVALLVQSQPSGDVPAALAVVLMAMCYAFAILYMGSRLAGEPPLAVAFGSLVVATIATTPAGLIQAPSHAPSFEVVASVVFLGVAGSALAYVLYYAIAAGAGGSRAVLVTYLVPPVAVFYGAVFLGEPVEASALGALALILGGVALGTGAVRRRRVGRVPA